MSFEFRPGLTDEKLNRIVANMPQVKREVVHHTNERAAIAQRRLLAHRYSGDAKVETLIADVDGYVILSDADGQKAALSLEYGRKPREYTMRIKRKDGTVKKVRVRDPGMKGLHVLGAALRSA